MLLPALTKKGKSAKVVPPAAGNIYDAFCDFPIFFIIHTCAGPPAGIAGTL
jgi:hypothetical protein